MLLILSLFLSCSRVFDSSGLFLLYVETYAKGCSLLRFFGGGVVVFF